MRKCKFMVADIVLEISYTTAGKKVQILGYLWKGAYLVTGPIFSVHSTDSCIEIESQKMNLLVLVPHRIKLSVKFGTE